MKLSLTNIAVLSGLTSAVFAGPSASALPMFAAPLTEPASFGVLVSLPENGLLNAFPRPSIASPPSFSALPDYGLWNPSADPSLRLTDWRHVFDISALGAFNVPLRDDPAERTNIQLAAQAVDNITLAPGEEFSFNTLVGERTPERGYQDGLMFDQGRIVRGTGGGICLVATGLYNAALHAGLEITERHPHSGLVGYAPPGCDAGIVYGQEDLRFRNTTETFLVIRTQPDGDQLAVRLYGHTPLPGHQVIVKPISLTPIPYSVVTKPDPTLLPGQMVVDQKPRAGYSVVLGRFWTLHGKVVRREIVVSERRAPRNEVRRVALPPFPTALPPFPTTLPAAPTALPSVPDLLGPPMIGADIQSRP
jgi:hypothetical protein